MTFKTIALLTVFLTTIVTANAKNQVIDCSFWDFDEDGQQVLYVHKTGEIPDDGTELTLKGKDETLGLAFSSIITKTSKDHYSLSVMLEFKAAAESLKQVLTVIGSISKSLDGVFQVELGHSTAELLEKPLIDGGQYHKWVSGRPTFNCHLPD